MFVRELLFLTTVCLHIFICCAFNYDERDNDGSDEENFKHNHNHPDDKEYDNRYDGRVIFRDYDEFNTYTTQKPRSLQACVLLCDIYGDDDPVCGTNGVTYTNINKLQCVAKCGVDVRLLHFSPCSGQTEVTSSTEANDKALCLSKCPTTPEYNPVCGTDNVTYKNQGKLFCAQTCGYDVHLKRHNPCPKTRATPPPQPYELNREIKDCIHLCPATSEYSPVCGSDGRTYYNNGKLQCARHCGVDVTVYRRSRCAN